MHKHRHAVRVPLKTVASGRQSCDFPAGAAPVAGVSLASLRIRLPPPPLRLKLVPEVQCFGE